MAKVLVTAKMAPAYTAPLAACLCSATGSCRWVVTLRTFLTADTETHADHEEHQERSQQALHGENPCKSGDCAGVYRPPCSLPMCRCGGLPAGGALAILAACFEGECHDAE